MQAVPISASQPYNLKIPNYKLKKMQLARQYKKRFHIFYYTHYHSTDTSPLRGWFDLSGHATEGGGILGMPGETTVPPTSKGAQLLSFNFFFGILLNWLVSLCCGLCVCQCVCLSVQHYSAKFCKALISVRISSFPTVFVFSFFALLLLSRSFAISYSLLMLPYYISFNTLLLVFFFMA